MLTTLQQAKDFIVKTAAKHIEGSLAPGEAELLETVLEERFLTQIDGLIDETIIEQQHFEKEEDLETYLFQHIPNYTTLLEECVSTILAEYFEPEEGQIY